MTDDDTRTIDRRTALAGLGTAATAAITGAGALGAFTGGAVAVGQQSLGPATIETDDGEVTYVAIHGDSVVEWSGFDTPATHVALSISLDVHQGGSSVSTDLPKQIHSTGKIDLSNGSWGSGDDSLSGPGTSGEIVSGIGLDGQGEHDPTTDWHVVGTDPDGYGLPSDPVDASYLSVGDGGDDSVDTTESFTLVLSSTYTWYDSGGSEIFSETFGTEIDVDVVNLAESADATGGSGGVTGA